MTVILFFRYTNYKTSSHWILHYLKSVNVFTIMAVLTTTTKILQEAFTNSSTAIKTRSQSIFFGGQVRLEVMRLGHGKQCEKYWNVRHICKRTKLCEQIFLQKNIKQSTVKCNVWGYILPLVKFYMLHFEVFLLNWVFYQLDPINETQTWNALFPGLVVFILLHAAHVNHDHKQI